MRILLDHNTPVPLRYWLIGHHVETAYERGWSKLTNGELLRMAEEADFDVMITTDQGIRYQQNLAGRRLALVVITKND
jgi:predicted nuclease of predicted toxin-antitoxin system